MDRSISSTITVGGATNAGTFEAAELMVAGMSAREASGVLFEQNLVVADSESTRRRLATATTKHLSFLEDDALRFVANRDSPEVGPWGNQEEQRVVVLTVPPPRGTLERHPVWQRKDTT